MLGFTSKGPIMQGERTAIPMEKSGKRMRHAACACCIAALLLAMGWFASRFVPGEPQSPSTAKQLAHRQFTPSDVRPAVLADEVVDVPFGTVAAIEGITRGKVYLREDFDDEQWAQIPDEVKPYIEQRLPVCAVQPGAQGDWWENLAVADDIPAFEIAIVGVQTVSSRSFADFYPAYLAALDYDPDQTVVLVDVEAANPSPDTEVAIPALGLWSAGLKYADGTDLTAIGMDKYLLGSLYPSSPENVGLISNGVDESWNVLAPGERRILTMPYLVSEGDLVDPQDLLSPDFADWCVQAFDYLPATCYRLWLAPSGLE